MMAILREFRLVFRRLSKSPGYALSAVLLLALGVCANTTVFSWIEATLLDPAPAADARGLAAFTRGEPSMSPGAPLSYLDFKDLQASTHEFSGLMAYNDAWLMMQGRERPQRVYGVLASANYFDVLGVRPALGRFFRSDEEEPSDDVVVISHDLWRTQFASDPQILGRRLDVNGASFTIVGVAPERFIGCKTALKAELWLPLHADNAINHDTRMRWRNSTWLNAVGRLRAGATLASAEREMNEQMGRLAALYPEDHRVDNRMHLSPMWRSPIGANIFLARMLPPLLGIALAVLLLTCANMATLTLVRFISRGRETAIREALGAGRARLMSEMMLETFLLALAGCALALLMTIFSARSLSGLLPHSGLPLALHMRINGAVVAFGVGLSLLSCLLSAAIPAYRCTRPAAMAALRERSEVGGRSRMLNVLACAQTALSLMLLVCAGLLMRTMQKASQIDPGFTSQQIFTANSELTPYNMSPEQMRDFESRLGDRLRAMPGVEAASIASWTPMSFDRRSDYIEIPDRPTRDAHDRPETRLATIDESFFATLRIPLLAGRNFARSDAPEHFGDPATRRIIVSRAFAERYWPGESPIGKQTRMWGAPAEVIGEVADIRQQRLSEASEPMAYLYTRYEPNSNVRILVRAQGEAAAVQARVEEVVRSIDGRVAIYDAQTMREKIHAASFMENVSSSFAATLGLLALLLSAVGLYGVISYGAEQRRHEIGIRLALGASRREVLRMVLLSGLRLSVIGIGAGVALALGAARLLHDLLFGVSEHDPLTLTAVVALMIFIALAASALPALRATRVDPMQAIRHE